MDCDTFLIIQIKLKKYFNDACNKINLLHKKMLELMVSH